MLSGYSDLISPVEPLIYSRYSLIQLMESINKGGKGNGRNGVIKEERLMKERNRGRRRLEEGEGRV